MREQLVEARGNLERMEREMQKLKQGITVEEYISPRLGQSELLGEIEEIQELEELCEALLQSGNSVDTDATNGTGMSIEELEDEVLNSLEPLLNNDLNTKLEDQVLSRLPNLYVEHTPEVKHPTIRIIVLKQLQEIAWDRHLRANRILIDEWYGSFMDEMSMIQGVQQLKRFLWELLEIEIQMRLDNWCNAMADDTHKQHVFDVVRASQARWSTFWGRETPLPVQMPLRRRGSDSREFPIIPSGSPPGSSWEYSAAV